jgi:hypothetical protein
MSLSVSLSLSSALSLLDHASSGVSIIEKPSVRSSGLCADNLSKDHNLSEKDLGQLGQDEPASG